MLDLLLHWFLSAGSLLIVAFLFPGIEVRGLDTALMAPIVIGFINATLGIVVKMITLPLTLLTLGIFWLIINGRVIILTTIPSVALMNPMTSGDRKSTRLNSSH